jgi:two-component system sensor histidine kinase BaeS
MIASLQTRLLLTVGALAVVAVASVAVVTRQGTRRDFFRLEELERRVDASQGAALMARVTAALGDRCCSAEALAAAARALSPTQALLVTDAGPGALVASAGAALRAADRVTTARQGPLLVVDLVARRGGATERISVRLAQEGTPLRLADGRDALVYVLPMPDPEREQRREAFLQAVDLRLLWATALISVLALGATWAIVRSSVRPLAALREAARDLARGNLAARVTPSGSREVAELGRDFNAMADDLERQHALRRQLLHDVAHELRTPLTALQCRLEAVIDGLAPDPSQEVRGLHDEVRHLGSLVNDLQDLALAEARALRLDLADLGLADAVRGAIASGGLAGDSRLRVEVPEGLTVRGDATRLRQIVVNLLSNADRHTPPGGRIEIAAAAQAGLVRLQVRNTGSHLSPDEIARVFDRFYRTDPARQRSTGGSGLGLAIVKHLVEAHGGTVAVESDGASVTVGVEFPRSYN